MTEKNGSGEERRRFTRIEFNAPVTVVIDGHVVDASLHDISLRGALIELNQSFSGKVGDVIDVTITLDCDTEIRMHSIVAHVRKNVLGISCEEIDLDSISHLKRLVELNLGDPKLLERDFDALYHSFSNKNS